MKINFDDSTKQALFQLLLAVVPLLPYLIGIVANFFERKRKYKYYKRSSYEQCFEEVCVPLLNVLLPKRDKSFEDIITAISVSQKIFSTHAIFIPESLNRKLDEISQYCACYESETDKKYKRVIQIKIRARYLNFYKLFNRYANDVKRILGYPFNSYFQEMTYTYVYPRIAAIFICEISLFVYMFYLVQILDKHYDRAIFLLIITEIVVYAINYIREQVIQHGGLIVTVLKLWKNCFTGIYKLKYKFLKK